MPFRRKRQRNPQTPRCIGRSQACLPLLCKPFPMHMLERDKDKRLPDLYPLFYQLVLLTDTNGYPLFLCFLVAPSTAKAEGKRWHPSVL